MTKTQWTGTVGAMLAISAGVGGYFEGYRHGYDGGMKSGATLYRLVLQHELKDSPESKTAIEAGYNRVTSITPG